MAITFGKVRHQIVLCFLKLEQQLGEEYGTYCDIMLSETDGCSRIASSGFMPEQVYCIESPAASQKKTKSLECNAEVGDELMQQHSCGTVRFYTR